MENFDEIIIMKIFLLKFARREVIFFIKEDQLNYHQKILRNFIKVSKIYFIMITIVILMAFIQIFFNSLMDFTFFKKNKKK